MLKLPHKPNVASFILRSFKKFYKAPFEVDALTASQRMLLSWTLKGSIYRPVRSSEVLRLSGGDVSAAAVWETLL